MKEMEKVQWDDIPYEFIVMVTTKYVDPEAKLFAADHNDMEVIFDDKFESYIGFHSELGLMYGHEPFLRNGIWLLKISPINFSLSGKKINPEKLSFQMIRS